MFILTFNFLLLLYFKKRKHHIKVCFCKVIIEPLLHFNLAARPVSVFQDYMDGTFGLALISEYQERLEKFPTLGLPSLATSTFCICLNAMSEIWKRFVYQHQRFPAKIFTLLQAKTSNHLLDMYMEMQCQMHCCKCCVDVEFSQVLLNYIPSEMAQDRNNVELWAKLEDIKKFLQDIARFFPLSSDTVECLHGYIQTRIHKFRGRKLGDQTAQEVSLWSTIKTTHQSFWNLTWNDQGDAGARQRLHRYNMKGTNQYTQPENRRLKPSPSSSIWNMANLNLLREQPAMAKAPKKLCGNPAEIWTILELAHINT